MDQTEEDSLRKKRKRLRFKSAGRSSEVVNVPFKRFVSVLTVLFSIIIFLVEADKLVKQAQILVRPLPAETIILKDGSTTYVSSLEEYLTRATTTVLSETETELNGTMTMTTTSATTSSLFLNELGVTNQVPNSSTNSNATNYLANELEREETTQSSPTTTAAITTTTTTMPTSEPHQQASSKLQQESHGHHHQAGHNHHAANSSSQKGRILQHYEVRGLLNVTKDYPLAFSQVICGYVWPLMAAITLFTNLMIVFVLTQNDMKTPTNVVLTAIAIADIVPIIVPVPWFVYLFAMGNDKRVLYPPIACYFYQHLTRSVSEIFYFLSTWLNVLLAVQDYLTACWPKLAKKYCQIKVVVIEVILLSVLAFLLNLPQALKLVYKPVKFFYNGRLTYGCKGIQASWFKELIGEYAALYDDVFTAIIVLFVDGGPAIALVTLTWLLIRQLQRQRIHGHLLMEQARTARKRRRERHRQQEYEASAKVMIFVLLAFLAVKLPFATVYSLMIIQSRLEIHFVESLNDFQKAITLIDLVFVLSYPLNFTIFCCCSKKFRHKCAELLGKCDNHTKSAKNRLIHSFSGSFNSETLSNLSNSYKRESSATLAFEQQQQQQQQVALPVNLDGLGQSHEFSEPPHQYQHQHQLQTDHQNQLTLANRNYQLDKICDGTNHFDLANYRPPEGIAQADLELAEFRALLVDGSLCFECIMRYEQIRAQWVQLSGHKTTGNSKRASTDSTTSWPTCPPSPPRLHSAQLYQNLPQIVTTKCDSIRERPSSEEADGSVGDCVVSSNDRIVEHVERASLGNNSRDYYNNLVHLEQTIMGNLGSHNIVSGVNLRKASGRTASMVSSEDGSMQDFNSIWPPMSASRSSSLIDGQVRLNQDWKNNGNIGGEDQLSREQLFKRSEKELDEHQSSSSRKLMRRSERGNSLLDYNWSAKEMDKTDRRFSDRPPSKLERMHLEMYREESTRRLTNKEGSSSERLSSSQGDNKTRNPSLSAQLEGSRQRSLSMSNSKLTALANATGLLAGILKTSLLTADAQDEQRQSSSVGHLTQALRGSHKKTGASQKHDRG